MSKSIEIVGAGPAGLVAAITLVKAGYKVKVYEEREDVGLRFQGDFQGIENWSQEEDVLDQLRQMGLLINFKCTPFYGGNVFGPNRESAKIQSDQPLFYLVSRGSVNHSLDQGLKIQALEAGVEIIFGQRIKKVEGRSITATGPKGADAIAKGVLFDTDLPDQALAILDERLAPGGYAYLLVNQGQATMATVLFRDYHREKECFERTQQAFHALVRFTLKSPREFGGYGNFYLRSTEVHGGHLYVGESAGFQDFLWGFGMRYAITLGYLAALSIIEGKEYDKLWRKQFLPGLRASLINRTLWDKFGQLAGRYAVRRLGRKDDTRNLMRRLYGWSFWKTMLLPFATWHYHSRVKDQRCRHSATCDCVWCRCQQN